TAEELLQAADLCLFVTTAQRYADALPWEFLRQAKARGGPLLGVANRLPRRDAAGRGGAGDAGRRRRALAELRPDPAALPAVKAEALRGALAGLPPAVSEVAADLE